MEKDINELMANIKKRYPQKIISEIAIQHNTCATIHDYMFNLKNVVENDIRQSKGVCSALSRLTNEEHLRELALIETKEQINAVVAKKK